MTTPTNHVITNDIIKDLRNFLVRVHQEYLHIKPSLSKDESVSDLQTLYSEVNAKIISMCKFLQYIEVDFEKKIDIMEVCKKLNLLLYDCGKDLEKMGVEKRHDEYEDIYGSLLKEIQNKPFQNKPLSNYKEIEKEFLDYIIVEPKKSNVEDYDWFKAGLKFANGDVYEYLELDSKGKNFILKKGFRPVDIVTKLKLEEQRPYVTDTLSGAIRPGNKNIYDSINKMESLEKYCIKHEIKICTAFLKKLEDKKNEKH